MVAAVHHQTAYPDALQFFSQCILPNLCHTSIYNVQTTVCTKIQITIPLCHGIYDILIQSYLSKYLRKHRLTHPKQTKS